MQSLVKFRRFRPQRTVAEKFESLVSDFAGLCASDSLVSCVVHRHEGRFIGDLSVRSAGGHIGVRDEASRLSDLMKKLLEKAYGDLRLWRRTRFNLPDLHLKAELRSRFKKPRTILLVEDNPSVAAIIATALKPRGINLTHVESTQAAIVEIANHHYDLVVMDWCLPYMTGGEVLERVGEVFARDPNCKRQIPVITYSALPRDEIHVPVSKFFRHLEHWDKSKPISTMADSAVNALDAKGK
ncbi:MAG: response regulator [Bdellovibrionota bacterium]